MKIPKHKPAGLGLFILTALVAGNMIGSGIFTLPASLASYGSISILGWVVTAIGAIFLALVFSQLSTLIPKTGGPYAYCRAAFGDFLGFEVAYNYWVALWVGNAAIVVTLVSYLAEFLPIIKQDPWISFAIKAGIVWLLTGINLMGVRNAGYVQVIATVLKLVPLLLIGIIGIFFIHPEYFSSFNLTSHSNLSALNASATMTLWAFIGLESATIPAGDVTNKRLIAKATLIGTLIATCVYILCTVTIMGLIPDTILAKSTAPFADAAKILFPGHASQMGYFIAIGAIISCFGTLNGWILLQGQIPLAAARDNLFPQAFAKENRRGAPAVGLIVSSILITLLLLFTVSQSLLQQFQLMILLAVLASLIPYFLTAMGSILITKQMQDRFTPAQQKRAIIIAIIASIYAFWAIAGSGMDVVFYGTLLFLSGVPVYIGMCWYNKTHSLELLEDDMPIINTISSPHKQAPSI